MTEVQEASVLVVEDNMDNMFVVVELLHHEVGVYFVDSTVTGYELFKMLDNKPNLTPHLILLDIQIPGEDGYTVLKRIRQHPRLTTTRVVAITANVMPQDVERATQAGFDGFIGKPINFERFPEQIKRILQGEAIWEAQ
ncbi:MAG: response regulator [Ardenticatenales bacterium]|nr:response regulator [Ardenticatenales bacterium]